tara:strand:- start:283 stop:636 length:354 start_codon:yes stop_codon:yes gene_type:complete
METKEDFLKSDQFETEWQSHLDNARDSFIDEVITILMPVQHLVDDIDQHVEINDVPTVAKAIEEASNLRFFDFTVEVEGKYSIFEQTLDYNFTKELIIVLRDELGYTSEYFYKEKRP